MRQIKPFHLNENGREQLNTKKLVFILLIFSTIFPFLASPALAQTSASIKGRVFEDLNLNNIFEVGEKGLSGLQVDLIQGGEFKKAILTNNSGYYYFDNLEAGDYWVKVNIPNRWTATDSNSTYVNLVGSEQKQADFGSYQIIPETLSIGPVMFISNESIQNISTGSAKIIWFTTHAATSQVVFGETSKPNDKLSLNDNNLGYPFSTPLDFNAVTYHPITLNNLKPGTIYYYRLVSLANPRQWRGAARVFSREFSFRTVSLPPEAVAETKESAQPPSVKPLPVSKVSKQTKITPSAETKPKGKILSLELETAETTDNLEKPKVITPTPTEKVIVTAPIAVSPETKETKEKPADCRLSIWLLLILNLILAGSVWVRGLNSTNSLVKNLWLIDLLVVIVPTIIWYPDCNLIKWLAVIAILVFIYLIISRRKSRQQFFTDNTFDSFKPTESNGTDKPASDKPVEGFSSVGNSAADSKQKEDQLSFLPPSPPQKPEDNT